MHKGRFENGSDWKGAYLLVFQSQTLRREREMERDMDRRENETVRSDGGDK